MNKIVEVATKVASKVYTQNMIAEKSANGTHNGESMREIYMRIMNDPNVTMENGIIMMHGKRIGWINPKNSMGWIDQKAYDQVAALPDEPYEIDSPYESDYDGIDEDVYDDIDEDDYSDPCQSSDYED